MNILPKKSLGQHFLHDENIAKKITGSLTGFGNYKKVLEVGPGTGVLSKYLLNNKNINWYGIEYDKDLVQHLKNKYPDAANDVIYGDILNYDLKSVFNNESFGVIGNFPYNISSQIIFKVLEHKSNIPEVVAMFQKEVALRLSAKHGNKTYGILSVLCQAFYDVEILFDVSANVFYPPPKVTSTVIRMQKKKSTTIINNEDLFFKIVKKAFNQRRKTLRNALKSITDSDNLKSSLFDKRAEQLSISDFVMLTEQLENKIKNDNRFL